MIIIQQPPQYNPVHNPIAVVLDSPIKNFINYRYILDIYVDGNLEVTLKTQPDPVYGYGQFNIAQVLEDYVKFNFDPDNNLVFQEGIYKEIQVRVGQEYFLSNGQFVINRNIEDLDNFFIFNGSLEYGREFDTSKVMTDKKNPKIYAGSAYWVDVVNDEFVTELRVTTFNESGTQLGTYSIPNPLHEGDGEILQPEEGDNPAFLKVGIGFRQFSSDALSYTVVSGQSDLITDAVHSYTVQFRRFSIPIKETITVTKDLNCSRFDRLKTSVYFLNYYGGLDAYNFSKRNLKSTEIDRVQGKRNLGTLTSTGINYNRFGRGIFNNYTETLDKRILNSDFVTDSDFKWLKQLVTSPICYIIEDGEFIAVNIDDVIYEEKTRVTNGLNNLQLEVSLGYNNRRQRI